MESLSCYIGKLTTQTASNYLLGCVANYEPLLFLRVHKRVYVENCKYYAVVIVIQFSAPALDIQYFKIFNLPGKFLLSNTFYSA